MKSKKFITFMLCLFFGGFGIHRFYTGHYAIGIIQLILTFSCVFFFVSALWVFIDFICILADAFKTVDGNNLIK